MKRAYCTFFDSRYLAKGLAMIASLRQADPGCGIQVLCLDEAAHKTISGLDWQDVVALRPQELEAADPGLAAARGDGRSTIEYYFTLKPSLIAATFAKWPDTDIVSYADGDLWFAAPLSPLIAEMDSHSVLLTPHRFPAKRARHEQYGLYNAGWVSFRRDECGLAALAWWREQVLGWCGDHVEEDKDRFADQRYLNRLPTLFPRVKVSQLIGANAAPWNAGDRDFIPRDGLLYIDGTAPLLFFHFHGLYQLAPRLFITANAYYGDRLTSSARRNLYGPYLRSLVGMRALADRTATRHATGQVRSAIWGTKNAWLKRFLRGLFSNTLIYVG